MKIDVMGALQYPFRDPDKATKWGLGMLFSAGIIVLLPFLCVIGFQLEALRMSSEGDDENLPGWDQFVNLGLKGVVGALIALVYMAVPCGMTVAGGLGAFFSVLKGASSSGAGPARFGLMAGGLGVSGIIGLLGMGLGLLISFLLPAIFARFARTGNAGEAFNLPGIIADIMISPLEYAVIYCVAFAISAVCTFARMALLTIPFFGIIISLAGGFYMGLVNANLMGQYCRANLSAE